jgi:hypothetical protein
MQIADTRDEDLWWNIAQNCKYATFFHTPLWHKLAVMTFPTFKDVTLRFNLSNGVRAVLPLLETKNIKGFGNLAQSTFAGCYGDLIADGPIDEEEMQYIYEKLRSRWVGRIQITSNPIAQEQQEIPGFSSAKDFTHILHLDSTFDKIFANFSKGHKSSFKKGRKMNVCVRSAATLDDYYAYYGAYEDSLRRWGDQASSRYPWTLFENGFYLSQEYPDIMKLWLATVDEEVVAGAWVFYWNQHVDWWHGAAYSSYFDHYPNNVLQTHIIKDAIAKGYRYYDFNPSGGHENVARFKGRFGAEKLSVSKWKYEIKFFHFGQKIAGLLKR